MEVRPLTVHVIPDTDEARMHAAPYVPMARAMLGQAQGMSGDGVLMNSFQRQLPNGIHIGVRSFKSVTHEFGPESAQTLFVAHITVPPGFKEDASPKDDDEMFAYLWVGRRTISGGDDGGKCGGATATSYLYVWEPDVVGRDSTGSPGGQVAGDLDSLGGVGKRGKNELADKKLNWDGTFLNYELGVNRMVWTDHNLVWRGADFYQERGLDGVPDREDANEFWDEEVYLDPSDGDDFNENPIVWQRPEDAQIEANARVLGALPVNKHGPFKKGKVIGGDYLIRILRHGNPCDTIVPTVDEVKVVAGRYTKQTIDTYRITTSGNHTHPRFVIPYGNYYNNQSNGLQWIPPGPCINYNEQFSADVVVASPWGGSRVESGKQTPGVESGGFDWQCSFPLAYVISPGGGYAWASLQTRGSQFCTATFMCFPIDQKWTGWYRSYGDEVVEAFSEWVPGGVSTWDIPPYYNVIPKDCDGNAEYWPPAFVGAICAAPVMTYPPPDNDVWDGVTPIALPGWPACGAGEDVDLPDSPDDGSNFQLFETDWTLYCPQSSLCSPATGCHENCSNSTAYDDVTAAIGGAYATPPRKGGLSGGTMPAWIYGLWFPSTDQFEWFSFIPLRESAGTVDQVLDLARSWGAWQVASSVNSGFVAFSWDDKAGAWVSGGQPQTNWGQD